jgi:hypothetical protein
MYATRSFGFGVHDNAGTVAHVTGESRKLPRRLYLLRLALGLFDLMETAVGSSDSFGCIDRNIG